MEFSLEAIRKDFLQRRIQNELDDLKNVNSDRVNHLKNLQDRIKNNQDPTISYVRVVKKKTTSSKISTKKVIQPIEISQETIDEVDRFILANKYKGITCTKVVEQLKISKATIIRGDSGEIIKLLYRRKEYCKIDPNALQTPIKKTRKTPKKHPKSSDVDTDTISSTSTTSLESTFSISVEK